jgi:hypothetical protein
MFVYSITAHSLWDSSGKLLTNKGKSGYGDAINNAYLTALTDIGATPCGLWQILKIYNSTANGALALPLLPLSHNAHNRLNFHIFGSIRADRRANGIVLPVSARLVISRSKYKTILIIE